LINTLIPANYDKINITIQTAIKLADALEYTIDELIDRDNNINNKQKEDNPKNSS